MAFHGEYREHPTKTRLTLEAANYIERAIFNHTSGKLSTARCLEDTDEYTITLLSPNRRLAPKEVRYFEGFIEALNYAKPWGV